MLTGLRFWRQRRTWWSSEGDTATDELIKCPRFHHAACQTKVETIAGGKPEYGVIPHQILVTLTDTQGDHHPIGERPQGHSGDGSHFDTAEQDGCTNIKRACFWRLHDDA
ncbi:Uncharacterised protein [Salmonella enterica subsp. enterica serovar Typhimurium str. DT104]|nr:Uncharacterised protein [Salmonella enterica subsp. enterica serovar Typhimurium str. DT104]